MTRSFDIVRVLRVRLHMSDKAAMCALSHGQVFIGDRCLGVCDRMIDVEANLGEMLTLRTSAGRVFRSYRLGSRTAPAPQAAMF